MVVGDELVKINGKNINEALKEMGKENTISIDNLNVEKHNNLLNSVIFLIKGLPRPITLGFVSSANLLLKSVAVQR